MKQVFKNFTAHGSSIGGRGSVIYNGDGNTITKNDVIVNGNDNRITGNNNKITGKNNRVTGNSNSVKGNHNRITGNSNTIKGNHNRITGNSNTVNGNHNRVTGNYNSIKGKHNRTSGRGNTTTGAFNVDNSGKKKKKYEQKQVFKGPMIFSGGSKSSTGTTNIIMRGKDGFTMKINNASGLNFGKGGNAVMQYEDEDGTATRFVGGNVQFGSGSVMNIVDGEMVDDDDDDAEFNFGTIEGSIIGATGGVNVVNNNNRPRKIKQFEFPEKKSEKIGENESEEHVCKVCFENKINTVILDCKHNALCSDCARRVLTEGNKKCPICRKDITRGIIDIYTS